MTYTPPDLNCPLCSRLVNFREHNRQKHSDFYNAPVPSFGAMEAELLVVGLAPGLKGANASGRPFTGDYAGIILYNALLKHGFAKGNYEARADDGLELVNCRITNAVRCVPPENKPEPVEIKTCNNFLRNEIAAMPKLKVILSLGQISHNAVLRALDYKQSHVKLRMVRCMNSKP
jgi:uracil-DNA glycosylase